MGDGELSTPVWKMYVKLNSLHALFANTFSLPADECIHGSQMVAEVVCCNCFLKRPIKFSFHAPGFLGDEFGLYNI